MTVSAIDGPLSVNGQRPAILGPVSPTGSQPGSLDYNLDLAPSLLHAGNGVRDPRMMPRGGAMGPLVAGGYPNQDGGWYDTGVAGIALIDAVPQALSANNIANVASVTTGVPLQLATTTTAAITVIGSAGYTLPVPLMASVPAGAVALDGLSGYLGAGQSGAFQFFNPAQALSRCISITGATSGTGGVFVVTGMDVYGQLMHQNITVAAGVNTVNSLKAFKYIISIVPQFTDSHAYTVGTTDIYGLPMRLAQFATAYSTIYYPSPTLITAVTGYTAAVTATATALTGDVRGTYALQSASNGTNRLQVFAGMSAAQAVAASMAAYQTAILGVTQF
jgi:hypothetical protein